MKQSFKNLFVALIGLTLSSTALHAQSAAATATTNITESATSAAKDAAKNVTKKAKAAKDATADTTKKAASKTKEAATKAMDKTKDTATTAVDKTKQATSEKTTEAKEKGKKMAAAGKAIPMYSRVDEINTNAKTFTQVRKDGSKAVNKVTAETTIQNGEKAATFSDIKVGDQISGLRTKNTDGSFTIIKITKFGAAPKKEAKEMKTEAKAKVDAAGTSTEVKAKTKAAPKQ